VAWTMALQAPAGKARHNLVPQPGTG